MKPIVFLDTGSPHYVHEIEDVRDVDVRKEGALIRYSPRFKEEGVNVNFVETLKPNELFVRTYERGVEDETLSCGTGVTACALHHIRERFGTQQVNVKTLGGDLLVRCENKDGHHFEEIWLCGPATFVFEGDIDIE
jgi:diaminopimelate epimerase